MELINDPKIVLPIVTLLLLAFPLPSPSVRQRVLFPAIVAFCTGFLIADGYWVRRLPKARQTRRPRCRTAPGRGCWPAGAGRTEIAWAAGKVLLCGRVRRAGGCVDARSAHGRTHIMERVAGVGQRPPAQDRTAGEKDKQQTEQITVHDREN